jgi:hypothetical protein
MAATLPSVVGRKDKRKDEEAVSGKDDILNRKINERMKRKQKLHELMNKIKDPDIA